MFELTDFRCGLKQWKVDSLYVEVYDTRRAMGIASAKQVSRKISNIIAEKGSVSMAFAAAPSQNEFLTELCNTKEVDWSRVTGFHLDEYIGLPEGAPQSFRIFLDDNIFHRISLGEVHYLSGNAKDLQNECDRYSRLLREHPLDIACIGIGENGHIAFNDPHVADFQDPYWVKVVDLDEKCRRQQVNDGCFPSIHDVPRNALTLTIPAIMSVKYIYCIVPGVTKQEAIKNTLEGPIDTNCPASILRTHESARLIIDRDASALLSDLGKSHFRCNERP
jgi:glucosamine-6-phosphate deaminase